MKELFYATGDGWVLDQLLTKGQPILATAQEAKYALTLGLLSRTPVTPGPVDPPEEGGVTPPPSTIGPAGILVGTDQFYIQRAGQFYSTDMAAVLAFIVANADALDTGPSLPDGFSALSLSSDGPILSLDGSVICIGTV